MAPLTPSFACCLTFSGSLFSRPYVIRARFAALAAATMPWLASSTDAGATMPANWALAAWLMAASMLVRLASAWGYRPMPLKNTTGYLLCRLFKATHTSGSKDEKVTPRLLVSVWRCTHSKMGVTIRSTSSGGVAGHVFGMAIFTSKFKPTCSGRPLKMASRVGSSSSTDTTQGSSESGAWCPLTPSKRRRRGVACLGGDWPQVSSSSIMLSPHVNALNCASVRSATLRCRGVPSGPVKITWSSCHRTTTPSAVTCKSNSTNDAPASAAFWHDFSVFSRKLGCSCPSTRVARLLPWPLCPPIAILRCISSDDGA
mmetsp:Transcript_7580/g.20165  ORF Transcript_7580/g.20165 Transcript_7580/m.20165 type:complete len:314 (-) Transcript_7580:141-1082(-)